MGDASPDVDPAVLKAMFNTTQALLAEGKLLAGHDISDGGIVTTVRCAALPGRVPWIVGLRVGDVWAGGRKGVMVWCAQMCLSPRPSPLHAL